MRSNKPGSGSQLVWHLTLAAQRRCAIVCTTSRQRQMLKTESWQSLLCWEGMESLDNQYELLLAWKREIHLLHVLAALMSQAV